MSGEADRVVVMLDAASENHTAIDTAAKLAAHAKARLHGIFLEDEDLWRLAGLPFARDVSIGTGTEPLIPDHIEAQLRTAAERARLPIMTWSMPIPAGHASGEPAP